MGKSKKCTFIVEDIEEGKKENYAKKLEKIPEEGDFTVEVREMSGKEILFDFLTRKGYSFLSVCSLVSSFGCI